LSIIYIFGGLGMMIGVFITAIPSFDQKSASDAMKIAFFLHPGYAFSQVCPKKTNLAFEFVPSSGG
jgi:hypothetical protein